MTGAWARHRWAAQTPRYPINLCLNYLHVCRLPRGVFWSPAISPSDCQDSSQHCSYSSATGTLLVSQLLHFIPASTSVSASTFLPFSEDHSLPSFSVFCCCFPAVRYKLCAGNVISEKFFMNLCQLVATNLLDTSFSC